MKILLLRYTLALIMCGVSASIWADEADNILLSENFSNFIFDNYSYSGGSKVINGWTVKWCELESSGVNNPPALLVTNRNSSATTFEGFAQTKSLGYSGNAILSFIYCRTAKKNTEIKVSILNGGVFEDTNTSTKTLTISQGSSYTFRTATYKLRNVTPSSTIKFEITANNYFAIDDVVVTKDELNEAGNNKYFIEANKTKTINVQTSRTLKHGIWNTMCLPFEVTTAKMQQALGTADFQMRTYTGYAGGVMTFTTASTIPAGTPFLVKPNTEEDIANPTFESVTINATADTVVNHDGVKFIGTYSGRDLNTDGTHLFITTDGTVAKPGDDTQNHLKGLRAYIEVPSGTTTPSRLNIDDETVDIQQIDADDDYSTALYDLKGLRLERPKKGLCIKDGKLIFIK